MSTNSGNTKLAEIKVIEKYTYYFITPHSKLFSLSYHPLVGKIHFCLLFCQIMLYHIISPDSYNFKCF